MQYCHARRFAQPSEIGPMTASPKLNCRGSRFGPVVMHSSAAVLSISRAVGVAATFVARVTRVGFTRRVCASVAACGVEIGNVLRVAIDQLACQHPDGATPLVRGFVSSGGVARHPSHPTPFLVVKTEGADAGGDVTTAAAPAETRTLGPRTVFEADRTALNRVAVLIDSNV